MVSADLMRVTAKDCNFIKARLVKADMREGDFENSNFNEASLYEANLERACLAYCSFDSANVERANFSNLRGGMNNVHVVQRQRRRPCHSHSFVDLLRRLI